MCIVSAVNDYGRTRIDPNAWTWDSFTQFQEILRQLAKLDAKLNQPDCETDDKLAWQADIERRLAALEPQP